MRVLLFYESVKIEGPKKKILEFNEAGKFFDDKELKQFEQLCLALQAKEKFHDTKVNDYGSKILDKIISLPVDQVFPGLDIYRIFLTHPDASCHYKKFEEGANHVYTVTGVLKDKNAGDPAKMLALRCLVNMFKEQTAIFVLREKREKVIEAICGHLGNAKANIREAAVTALLNYSVVFLQKEDKEGQIQVMSGLGSLAGEKEEQVAKRLDAAVQNLIFKNSDASDLAKAMGLLK